MYPQKNFKSRSSEMRFSAFWASKGVLFLWHLKISVVVVVAVFPFFINGALSRYLATLEKARRCLQIN